LKTPGADFAGSLAGRKLLVRLLSSVHMSIEPGLTLEGLHTLKTWFLDFARHAASDLENRYPDLQGKGLTFLLSVYALALGVSQLCFPPEGVRVLIERDKNLRPFQLNFAEFIATSVDALYLGMRKKVDRD
jgi:hypothetical protein